MTSTDPQAYQAADPQTYQAAYVNGYQHGYVHGYRQGYQHRLEDRRTGAMRAGTRKMGGLIRRWFRGAHPDEHRADVPAQYSSESKERARPSWSFAGRLFLRRGQ